MRKRRAWLGIAMLCAACGARTGLSAPSVDEAVSTVDASTPVDAARTRDSGSDSGIDADVDAASICVSPDGGLQGPTTCTKTLVAGTVTRSSLGCFVDIVLQEGDVGTLTYDCDGGGAEITFGTSVFTGSFDGTRVDVCIGTSFVYSDGCDWNSAQRIQGDLTTALRFDYVEAPAPGQTNCASACSATTNLAVE